MIVQVNNLKQANQSYDQQNTTMKEQMAGLIRVIEDQEEKNNKMREESKNLTLIN